MQITWKSVTADITAHNVTMKMRTLVVNKLSVNNKHVRLHHGQMKIRSNQLYQLYLIGLWAYFYRL